MIILVDCDGVLADFVTSLCSALGNGLTPEHFRDWSLENTLTPEQSVQAKTIMNKKGFCAGFGWYPGAKEFVGQLKELGTVYCVTAPYPSKHWLYERMQWLKSLIPGSHVLNVSGESKHLIKGDLLIEDHPTNLAHWLDAHPGATGLLVDRPWNRVGAPCWRQHDRMTRVYSFDDAISALWKRVPRS